MRARHLWNGGGRRRRRLPGVGGGLNLVAPGFLHPALGLIRAQPGGSISTALGPDGQTWQQYAADVARFNGAARRLLIGGQRTNAVRNARAEGAVAGTPGTLPTNWAIQSDPGGTRTLTPETRNGIPGVRIQYSGNATASAALQIRLETATAIAALSGQTWTGGFFYQLDAMTGYSGSPSISCRVEERNAAGAFLTAGAASVSTVPSGFRRIEHARTLNNASTAYVTVVLGTTATTSGQPVSLDLWVGGAQLEQASFASTPTLHAVGTPAASTRGADLISASLASLGIGAGGACTVLWSGMIPQAAPSGVNQFICEISDTTANNRVQFYNPGGGSFLIVQRVNAGASVLSSNAGPMTPGTPFAAGWTIDGAGRSALSVGGASVVAVTGAPTAGLNTLRLGSNVSSVANLFGETARLRVFPYAMSDADLRAAVAAFPTS